MLLRDLRAHLGGTNDSVLFEALACLTAERAAKAVQAEPATSPGDRSSATAVAGSRRTNSNGKRAVSSPGDAVQTPRNGPQATNQSVDTAFPRSQGDGSECSDDTLAATGPHRLKAATAGAARSKPTTLTQNLKAQLSLTLPVPERDT